ncbi:hypothetical protein B0H10DRAFT_1949873 [Mycena sp. CBHHK59/15]|nr:hypothetical protein B0H10DRAFT_1949873 [Mycena sp. CBHHK59/15]
MSVNVTAFALAKSRVKRQSCCCLLMLDPSKARRYDSPDLVTGNIDGWQPYTRLDGSEYYTRDAALELTSDYTPAHPTIVVDDLRLRTTVDDITFDVTFEELYFVRKDQWLIILHSSQTAFYSSQHFVDIKTRRRLYWQYIATHPSHTTESLGKWLSEAHSLALVYLKWCSFEALTSSTAKIPFPLKQSQDLTEILASLNERPPDWTYEDQDLHRYDEDQRLLPERPVDVEVDVAEAAATERALPGEGGTGGSLQPMGQISEHGDDASDKEGRDSLQIGFSHPVPHPVETAAQERRKLRTALIAKVLTEKCTLLTLEPTDSQQGAVDNSADSEQPPQPSVALNVLFWVVDVTSLGSFIRYLRRLEEVRATILSDDQWREHIMRLVREWEEFNLISTVLLSASAGILALENIGGVPRTAILISILSSFGSVTTGLYCISMYQLRAPDSRDSLSRTSALTIFNYNQYTLTHKGIALILGLPMAFLVWSLVSFMVGILSFNIVGTETRPGHVSDVAYVVISVAAVVFGLIALAFYSLSRLWQAGRSDAFHKNIWRRYKKLSPRSRPQSKKSQSDLI